MSRSTGPAAVTPGRAAYRPPCPAAAGDEGLAGAAIRRSAPAWKSAWSSWDRRQVDPVATHRTPTATVITSSRTGPATRSGRRLTW
ncbi:hypothetical protein [Actinoallomurus acanthiterrae]